MATPETEQIDHDWIPHGPLFINCRTNLILMTNGKIISLSQSEMRILVVLDWEKPKSLKQITHQISTMKQLDRELNLVPNYTKDYFSIENYKNMMKNINKKFKFPIIQRSSVESMYVLTNHFK